MYDLHVTQSAIEKATLKQGWELVPHSASQVASAVLHFNDLMDEDAGTLKRPLTKEEQRFIQNERRLSALDARYWYTRYARVIHWSKTVVPFIPNIAQEIVLDLWGTLEAKAFAIMMLQLKARQLGVTTLTEMEVCRRFQFHSRTNAVVASADPKKSIKMAKMIRFCTESQPWWLLPSSPKDKIEHGMTVEYAKINSSLLIQAGNQFNGVARGDTPNVAHLSEIASWPDPELLIDSALLNAIHEDPNVFVILEGTAEQRGDWLHKKWKMTKAAVELGTARLLPIFLPWFVGIDIYPTVGWLRMHPVPPSWIPSDLVVAHAERARQYVKSNTLLRTYLAKGDPNWQMPPAQMWWYELNREEATKNNQLNLFLREMPADDLEAFQSANISVIKPEVVELHRSQIREPLGVYTITGTGIPYELTIPQSQWDTSKEPVFINAASVIRSNETFTLFPLKFEGYSDTYAGLRLFIYEWPEDDQEYGLGVDTSDGVGLDWSVVSGLRKSFPYGPDTQVCEFASPYIKALQLWPMTLALGCLYSPYRSKLRRTAQCRVAIECKGNGETVQYELQKRGWFNFHPWKKLDNRKVITPGEVHKIGVFTNAWYRPMMLDRLLTMLDEGNVQINSPFFVDEMEALEKDENRQALKATYGEHDDRIMALGFILDSLHVEDRPYGRSAYVTGHQMIRARTNNEAAPAYAAFTPGLQASDTPSRQNQPFVRGVRGSLTLGRTLHRGVPPRFR